MNYISINCASGMSIMFVPYITILPTGKGEHFQDDYKGIATWPASCQKQSNYQPETSSATRIAYFCLSYMTWTTANTSFAIFWKVLGS